MDFELVLKTLTSEFDRRRIRYAAIGGFALGILGFPRATMDLDFLVHIEDLAALHDTLTPLHYERVFHTVNVSQYRHADDRWGSLDFIHAFRKISLGMLERAKSYPVAGGQLFVKSAAPEDVIGLKVQAMSNDPSRRALETHDIEGLMSIYRAALDWERLQEFYELFEFGDEAKRLKDRFGHAQ